MPERLSVLVIFAHPDEGEIYAGGTVALFTRLGHDVRFLSLTNGDAGHFSMSPEDLATRRYGEAMDAKRIMGLDGYEILDYHDGFLQNTEAIRQQVAAKISDCKADLVFTFYPAEGGHNDNMTAGWIVRDVLSTLSGEQLPAVFYMRDFHTSKFCYLSDVAVIIDDVWQTKLEGCGAHVSQVLEYNPYHEGVLAQVQASEEKQKEFRFNNTYAFSHVRADNTAALERWYGTERARSASYVEAFEVAECGRQVTDREVLALFPMLDPAPGVGS